MLGTVEVTEEGAVNKREKKPCYHGIYTIARETDKRKTNQEACLVMGAGQDDGGNKEGGWALRRDWLIHRRRSGMAFGIRWLMGRA